MTGTPSLYERRVRFEEVDAAGIVFFARYLGYCHEAMEAMFGPLDGGYANLVTVRKLGFPAVRVEIDYNAPLRFGDTILIATTVEHIGTSSCVLRYELTRKGGDLIATMRHIVVVSDLTRLRSTPIPDDVRKLLAAHFVPRPPL